MDFVDDEALIIIMGDHQPNAHITGPNTPPLVPIHMLSRKNSLIQPFIHNGYSSGIFPPSHGRYQGMDTFLGDFLTAFSNKTE
jgi:hypothetical protein